MSNQYQDR